VRVFITGATGLVGSHLVPALLGRGDDVVCISRSPERAALVLPADCRIVTGDPVAPGAWQQELLACDAVVNLAGESVGDGLWTRGKKRRIRRSRLATTENLVQGLADSERPAVMISASATGYYGDGGDRALGEDCQPGQDFLARLAVEWENTARKAESDRVRVVTLRVGIVLAAEGGALPRMLTPFRLGLGGPLGNGRQYFPWIHIDDLVGIISFVLEHDRVSGPVNAVVPDPPRQGEFATAVGRALAKPAFMAAPRPLLKLVLGEKADMILASQRAVPNALKAAGYRFRYSEMDSALADLLQSGDRALVSEPG